MKIIALTFVFLFLFPALVLGGEKEDGFLKEHMIPLARAFIKRNHVPCNPDFETNKLIRLKVDFFDDGRPGCLATMMTQDRFWFDFQSDGKKTDIRSFHSSNVRTYYELDDAPKEKIEAVKALNLRNKLNLTNALQVAKQYFQLQGHDEKNFHPPTIRQCYWIGKDEVWGNLPYYEVEWYRKDVNLADRSKGITTLPEVSITVSGVDSSLIYYLRSNLPIGSDF